MFVYLRKEIVSSSKDHSDLEVLSFDTLNNVFKINWLIQYLKNKESIRNSFPKYLFKQLGDFDFLLKCKVVKLAKFHKQALMA